MFNKKLLPAALATTFLAVGTIAQAEMEVSANVALTTDYKFRGISQSDESPALQGGFDLAFDNGMYVGTWASSVDFDTDGSGFDGSLELDYYVGWAGDVVDVGILMYTYPGDDGADGDYLEFYGNVAIGDGSIGLVYSDDYYGETGTFYYVSGDYSFALGENLSLDLHVGYNDLDSDGGFLSDGQDSYIDYSVGLTTSFASVDLTLAVIGTDLDEDEVFGTDWGDDSVIFTISKSM